MSEFPFHPARPPTPQAMLHRLPDKPDPSSTDVKPSKYIVLITGSTGVAGKLQIAKSVSEALSCPLFQGESLHESSAKAASVGAIRQFRHTTVSEGAVEGVGSNEARYERMWLSKMTRTGLLFPEESRPATEGFSGFGGAASTSTSRRGSSSSMASSNSDAAFSSSSGASSFMFPSEPNIISQYINKPPSTLLSTFTTSETERLRRANRALMVLTHPELEGWHREAIRRATGEYGIGIIFVPLYEDMELPILKPLDPKTMTSFDSFGSRIRSVTLKEEIVLRINVDDSIEAITEEIIEGVRDLMGIEQ